MHLARALALVCCSLALPLAAAAPQKSAPKKAPPSKATSPAPACVRALPRTASLGGHRAGVFYKTASNEPADLLASARRDFPGLKTFLWYKGFGSPPAALDRFLADARREGVVPQLGFEPSKFVGGRTTAWDLATIDRQLAQRSGEIYQDALAWARYLKGKGLVMLRPLSEMNDAGGSWELGAVRQHPGNTPAAFAQAWCRLHRVFDEAGATNVLFLFDVFEGTPTPSGGSLVSAALRAIPKDQVDAVGIHPYSRLRSGAHPISFQAMVAPWIALYRRAGFSKPVVIGEMGVSDNRSGPNAPAAQKNAAHDQVPAAWDRERAQWIHDAFAYARRAGIAMITYFDQQDTNWRLAHGSQAQRALANEIAHF